MFGGLVLAGGSAQAAGAKHGKSASAGKAPTLVNKRFKTAHGVQWGMSPIDVAKQYDRYFERAFLGKYKKAQPGPQRQMLDAELAGKQAELRRLVKFGSVPTGIDNTPLKGEYTYNNKEALSTLRLKSGTKRHFFFIQQRLWKVYSERKLGPKASVGSSFDDAVRKMTKKLGAPPAVHRRDFAKGRLYKVVEWTDGRTILRMVNREEEGLVGLVKVHTDTFNRLASLRTNQAKETGEIDSDVEMVTRKPDAGPVDPNNSAADAYIRKNRKN